MAVNWSVWDRYVSGMVMVGSDYPLSHKSDPHGILVMPTPPEPSPEHRLPNCSPVHVAGKAPTVAPVG